VKERVHWQCDGYWDKLYIPSMRNNLVIKQKLLPALRISDLRERITLSFGDSWAASFSSDIALSELGSKSVNEALAAGFEPDVIWKAVCKAHPSETEKYKY
jgi:hypothetical protein